MLGNENMHCQVLYQSVPVSAGWNWIVCSANENPWCSGLKMAKKKIQEIETKNPNLSSAVSKGKIVWNPGLALLGGAAHAVPALVLHCFVPAQEFMTLLWVCLKTPSALLEGAFLKSDCFPSFFLWFACVWKGFFVSVWFEFLSV